MVSAGAPSQMSDPLAPPGTFEPKPGAETAAKKRKTAFVSRTTGFKKGVAAFDPALKVEGVKLGCGTCRHIEYGCAVCRKRAGFVIVDGKWVVPSSGQPLLPPPGAGTIDDSTLPAPPHGDGQDAMIVDEEGPKIPDAATDLDKLEPDLPDVVLLDIGDPD